ncbi:hypothetical protein Efla_005040 [Eimeria flavescens]
MVLLLSSLSLAPPSSAAGGPRGGPPREAGAASRQWCPWRGRRGAPPGEPPRAPPPFAGAPASGAPPSGCPMHRSRGRSRWVSSWLGWGAAEEEAAVSSRPSHAEDGQGGGEGDVQKLNPLNMMPFIDNTADTGLSTHRETSTIPKTGGDKSWVYPSSAQFFKALQRRGKETDESSVPAVVYIHNYVNEATWKKIKQLEKTHPECERPSLTRFCGRSEDLSFTGRLMTRLGWWGSLFDRHDWYVDRCGKSVRYIIDFYDDPTAANVAEVSLQALHAFGCMYTSRSAEQQMREAFFCSRQHLLLLQVVVVVGAV